MELGILWSWNFRILRIMEFWKLSSFKAQMDFWKRTIDSTFV